ncbi:MAG: OmpA family protein [Mariprofundus sp.]|nr:OmpA family protein [Mariprofundus sp.]
MAKREKKPEILPFPSDPGAALFLELMMQMLAFFILLTSYAVIVDEKRLAAIGSLAGTFNPMPRGANLADGDGPALPVRSVVDGATAPKRTAKELTEVAKDLGLGDAMQVIPLDQQSVKIRFNENIAFASGQMGISKSALPLINRLATSFQRPEVIEVQIEGHTDDKPTRGGMYRSNWELSAARAMAVFTAFAERGVPKGRMITAGMGDQHPIKNHPELSRRVEITLKFRPVSDKVDETSKGPLHKLQHSAVTKPRQ